MQGIKVAHHKNTADSSPVKMPVPDKVTIPLLMHMGEPCEPIVKVGDTVTVGQIIGNSDKLMSVPVHSSVSGEVTAIKELITVNSRCLSVEITTDKNQTICPDINPPVINSHKDLVEAAKNCGLVGLGGAGFPTHIKLDPKNPVDTLIVNGAECEPYITSDARTMIDKTEELLAGIELVKKYLNINKVIIGVEDNKADCISKLKATNKNSDIEVRPLRTKYPQGAEKVLIYETTRRVVNEKQLPCDVGVLVMNVATVATLYEFSQTGMPLIEKVVTVDGSAVTKAQNVIVPIGTSIKDLVDFCGGYSVPPKKILMGGPMMGIVVPDDSYPIIKNTNAILAFSEKDSYTPVDSNCIRCGKCVRACPVNLMPLLIHKAYVAKNKDELKRLKVNICIECGCCSYVCPAKIHLVVSNKMGKQLIKEKDRKRGGKK